MDRGQGTIDDRRRAGKHAQTPEGGDTGVAQGVSPVDGCPINTPSPVGATLVSNGAQEQEETRRRASCDELCRPYGALALGGWTNHRAYALGYTCVTTSGVCRANG